MRNTILAILLASASIALGVGEKLPGNPVQRACYYRSLGYTNGCPIAVSPSGIVLANPDDIPLPKLSDLPSVAQANALQAAFLAARGAAQQATTNFINRTK